MIKDKEKMMRKIKIVFVISIFLFNLSLATQTGSSMTNLPWQEKLKVGTQLNVNNYIGYFDKHAKNGKLSPGIGGYLDVMLARDLYLNLALDYNQVKIKYKPELLNNIIQSEMNAKYFILKNNQIYPYLKLGLGLFSFTQDNGFSGRHTALMMKSGLGVEVPVANLINLNFGLNLNTTLKQKIDLSPADLKLFEDHYLNMSMGISFRLPGGESHKSSVEAARPQPYSAQNLISIEPQDSIESLKDKIEERQEQIAKQKEMVEESDKKIQALAGLIENKNDKIATLAKKARGRDEAKQQKMADSQIRAKYNEGLTLFNQKNYKEAAKIFSQLLENTPNHELSSNIAYWAGESYYGLENYEVAKNYFDFVKKYPDSPKSDDALIMAGQSLLKMGNNAQADAVFKELLEKYPDSEYAKLAHQYLAKD